MALGSSPRCQINVGVLPSSYLDEPCTFYEVSPFSEEGDTNRCGYAARRLPLAPQALRKAEAHRKQDTVLQNLGYNVKDKKFGDILTSY